MKKFRMARLLTTVLLVMTMVASMSACAPDQKPILPMAHPLLEKPPGPAKTNPCGPLPLACRPLPTACPSTLQRRKALKKKESMQNFWFIPPAALRLRLLRPMRGCSAPAAYSPAITGMLNIDMRVVGSCMSDDAMVDLWAGPDSPIRQSGPRTL